MPLLDIRKKFIEFTGRYDLVVDDDEWADNGADFFIRSGQKWLDRFGHIYKAEARVYQPLNSGDWFTTIPSRTIREVWISDEEGNKWQLKKQEYKHIRKCFPYDPGKLDPSRPKWYAITPIRTIGEVDNLTIFDVYDNVVYSNQYYVEYVTLRNSIDDVYTLLIDSAHQILMLYGVAPITLFELPLKDKYNGAIYNSVQMTAFNNPSITLWLYPDIAGQVIVSTSQPPGPLVNVGKQLDLNSSVMTADYITGTTLGEASVHIGADLTPASHYANTGLVFLPPASAGMELEILGAFEQAALKEDSDVNYWTEEQPIILVMAACRAIEQSYRNKEGVADWEAAIKSEILGLEYDLAEMESNEFTNMEG